jgi:hypothetical protein
MVVAAAAAALSCSDPPSSLGRCADPAACDDANLCTTDTCAAAGCSYAYAADAGLTLLRAALGDAPTVALPTASGTFTGGSYTFCPAGADPGASPPSCTLELALASATATLTATSSQYHLAGRVPLRVQSARLDYSIAGSAGTSTVTLSATQACPAPGAPFAPLDAEVSFEVAAAPGDAVVVQAALSETQLEAALALCGGTLGSFAATVRPIIATSVAAFVEEEVVAELERQLCLAGPTCPAGSSFSDGLCRYSGGGCVFRGVAADSGLLRPLACLP